MMSFVKAVDQTVREMQKHTDDLTAHAHVLVNFLQASNANLKYDISFKHKELNFLMQEKS